MLLDSSATQRGDGIAEMTFSSYDSHTGQQQSMHSRHISDRVHTLPSHTCALCVGIPVMSVLQLMLLNWIVAPCLVEKNQQSKAFLAAYALLMPMQYAILASRATQPCGVRAADRVRRAPTISCRTCHPMACLALRGSGQAATRAGSLLRRTGGPRATTAPASWTFPQRGCMQHAIRTPAEGGECLPVPSIEASRVLFY